MPFIVNPESGRKVDLFSKRGQSVLTRYLENYNRYQTHRGGRPDEAEEDEGGDDSDEETLKKLYTPKPLPCPNSIDQVQTMPVRRSPKDKVAKKYYSKNFLNETAKPPPKCFFGDTEEKCTSIKYSKKGKKCKWEPEPDDWDKDLGAANKVNWWQCDSPEHRNYIKRQMNCLKKINEQEKGHKESLEELNEAEENSKKKDQEFDEALKTLQGAEQEILKQNTEELKKKNAVLKLLKEAREASDNYIKQRRNLAKNRYDSKMKIIEGIKGVSSVSCNPQVICPSWCSGRLDLDKKSKEEDDEEDSESTEDSEDSGESEESSEAATTEASADN